MTSSQKWRVRYPLLLVLVAVFVPATVLAQSTDQTDAEAWSEENAVKLALEVTGRPKTDLSQTTLKLTVTNTSKEVIVFDKELSVGFRLDFRTDLTDESTRSEERDVWREEIKGLPKPSPKDVETRFVRLKPGESLSRTYDLSKPLRDVQEGHATEAETMVHHGFYYEATVRYRIPPRAKKLWITVRYERGVWMMAEPQFESWFGASMHDLGVWTGRAYSNTVAVEKP